MAKLIPGAITIVFIVLNLIALGIIIAKLSSAWAIAITLLIIMLVVVITRIEMKGAVIQESLRRRKMQDTIADKLDSIVISVEEFKDIFSHKTDIMFDKLQTNVDMQRRVWTHDFEIKNRELTERVSRIEEKVDRLKRTAY